MSSSRAHIAVVTDSAADLPAAWVDRYAVQVVPAMLVVDGRSYPDGQGVSRQDFYDRMRTERAPATTASPSPESFSTAFEAALASGAESVLSLHVSGRLSGIADIAQRAAASFAGRVRVVDSGQASLGTGYQVLAAAQAAADGMSLNEVLRVVDDVRRRIRLIAMIDDLEFLRRSGRVDWLRSSLGALLHIRVLIELADGIVHRLSQVRSRARAVELLVQSAATWGALEHLAVLHASARQDASALARRLAAGVAQEPVVIDVTTVIGTHVGPGSLGLVGVLAAPSTVKGHAAR